MFKPRPTPAVLLETVIYEDGFVPVLSHPSGSIVVPTDVCITPSVAARHGRYWAPLVGEIVAAVDVVVRSVLTGRPAQLEPEPNPVIPHHTCTLGRPERWCERCEIEEQLHRELTEVP